jgi:hypothetical protein
MQSFSEHAGQAKEADTDHNQTDRFGNRKRWNVQVESQRGEE